MENKTKNEKHFIADIPLKALIVNSGKVLLVRDSGGAWELPGGRINEGEKIEEALKRELMEELGVHIEVKNIFDAFCFVSASGKNHFVAVYECEATNLGDMNMADGEVKELKWVGVGEFESLSTRQYDGVLKKYFSQL